MGGEATNIPRKDNDPPSTDEGKLFHTQEQTGTPGCQQIMFCRLSLRKLN